MYIKHTNYKTKPILHLILQQHKPNKHNPYILHIILQTTCLFGLVLSANPSDGIIAVWPIERNIVERISSILQLNQKTSCGVVLNIFCVRGEEEMAKCRKGIVATRVYNTSLTLICICINRTSFQFSKTSPFNQKTDTNLNRNRHSETPAERSNYHVFKYYNEQWKNFNLTYLYRNQKKTTHNTCNKHFLLLLRERNCNIVSLYK